MAPSGLFVLSVVVLYFESDATKTSISVWLVLVREQKLDDGTQEALGVL